MEQETAVSCEFGRESGIARLILPPRDSERGNLFAHLSKPALLAISAIGYAVVAGAGRQ